MVCDWLYGLCSDCFWLVLCNEKHKTNNPRSFLYSFDDAVLNNHQRFLFSGKNNRLRNIGDNDSDSVSDIIRQVCVR